VSNHGRLSCLADRKAAASDSSRITVAEYCVTCRVSFLSFHVSVFVFLHTFHVYLFDTRLKPLLSPVSPSPGLIFASSTSQLYTNFTTPALCTVTNRSVWCLFALDHRIEQLLRDRAFFTTSSSARSCTPPLESCITNHSSRISNLSTPAATYIHKQTRALGS